MCSYIYAHISAQIMYWNIEASCKNEIHVTESVVWNICRTPPAYSSLQVSQSTVWLTVSGCGIGGKTSFDCISLRGFKTRGHHVTMPAKLGRHTTIGYQTHEVAQVNVKMRDFEGAVQVRCCHWLHLSSWFALLWLCLNIFFFSSWACQAVREAQRSRMCLFLYCSYIRSSSLSRPTLFKVKVSSNSHRSTHTQ